MTPCFSFSGRFQWEVSEASLIAYRDGSDVLMIQHDHGTHRKRFKHHNHTI
jgi:hypothetical protein